MSNPDALFGIQLQTYNENAETWGHTYLNGALEQIIQGIASVVSIATTGGTTTLSSDNYLANQNRRAVLDVSGTLTSDATLVVWTRNKRWLVKNGTSGAFGVTVKTASGTGIVVPQGTRMEVYCDGTNVVAGNPTAFNSERLQGVATPTASTDAATKGYVDGRALSNFTGSVAANISFNSFKLTSLASGTVAADAVNKGQLDAAIAAAVIGGAAGTFRTTSTDTTAKFASTALVATGDFTLSVLSPGANETLQWALSSATSAKLAPAPASADAGRHPIVNAGGTAYSTSTYSEEELVGLTMVM